MLNELIIQTYIFTTDSMHSETKNINCCQVLYYSRRAFRLLWASYNSVVGFCWIGMYACVFPILDALLCFIDRTAQLYETILCFHITQYLLFTIFGYVAISKDCICPECVWNLHIQILNLTLLLVESRHSHHTISAMVHIFLRGHPITRQYEAKSPIDSATMHSYRCSVWIIV